MIVINWFQEKPDYLHRPPGYDKTNTSSVVKMLRHPDSNRDELSSSTHLRFDIPIIECCVYHSTMSQCFPTSTWTGLFILKYIMNYSPSRAY